MPVTTSCSQCGKPIQLPDGLAAPAVECPHCGAAVRIAAGAANPLALLEPSPVERSVLAARQEQPPLALPVDGAAAPAGARRSRYTGRQGGATAAADIVVREFECEGRDLAARTVEQQLVKTLKDEGCFESVLLSDELGAYGRKATVDAGLVSIVEDAGGFMKRSHSTVAASAKLVLSDGREHELSAQNRLQSLKIDQMLAANSKVVATKFAKEVVHETAGYKRLRKEVSGMATASCVFGFLAIIPVVGVLLYVIALILGLVAWSYNSTRPEKVSIVRVPVGLIAGLLLIYFWATSIKW